MKEFLVRWLLEFGSSPVPVETMPLWVWDGRTVNACVRYGYLDFCSPVQGWSITQKGLDYIRGDAE